MKTENQEKEKSAKEAEVELRRMEVEKLHTIRGLSISVVAEQLGVDPRTIDRDVRENRYERVKMLNSSDDAKEWLRNEIGDTVVFLKEARRTFYEQSLTFKTEAVRTKALWSAVEVESRKVDIIKSLIWSFYDIQIGGHELKKDYDPSEK